MSGDSEQQKYKHSFEYLAGAAETSLREREPHLRSLKVVFQGRCFSKCRIVVVVAAFLMPLGQTQQVKGAKLTIDGLAPIEPMTIPEWLAPPPYPNLKCLDGDGPIDVTDGGAIVAAFFSVPPGYDLFNHAYLYGTVRFETSGSPVERSRYKFNCM